MPSILSASVFNELPLSCRLSVYIYRAHVLKPAPSACVLVVGAISFPRRVVLSSSTPADSIRQLTAAGHRSGIRGKGLGHGGHQGNEEDNKSSHFLLYEWFLEGRSWKRGDWRGLRLGYIRGFLFGYARVQILVSLPILHVECVYTKMEPICR